ATPSPHPTPDRAPAAATAPGSGGSTSLVGEATGRFRIRDNDGRCVVARLYGQYGGKTGLLQPDSQLGYPNRPVPTDERFVPLTADELRSRLEQKPYAGFAVIKTEHYLVFYQSRLAFAQDSARLLEDLYRGLSEFCRRHGLPVHSAEFPLVA